MERKRQKKKERNEEKRERKKKERRHGGQKYINKRVINEINRIKINEAIRVLSGLSKTGTKSILFVGICNIKY